MNLVSNELLSLLRDSEIADIEEALDTLAAENSDKLLTIGGAVFYALLVGGQKNENN